MITRLEIIDYTQETPRQVVVSPDDNREVTYSLQDNDRTLKVFVEKIND